MNIQIIKKRLRELKQLSQNIKKGTQNRSDQQHSLDLIRIVIEKTKNMSPSSPHKQNNYTPPHRTHNNLFQTSDNWKNRQKLVENQKIKTKQPKIPKYMTRLDKIQSKSYQQQSIEAQQLYQNMPINSKSSSPYTKIKTQNGMNTITLQQVTNIVEQNKSLNQQLFSKDQTIRLLREQIQNLNKEKNKMLAAAYNSQDDHQNIKYFKMKLLTNVFVTYISIDKSDYHRIQYQTEQLKLSLNNIKIHRKIGNRGSSISSATSNIPNSTSAARNTYSKLNVSKNLRKDKQKLDLSDLQSVSYLDQLVMLMIFKQDDNLRHVYVKFDKYQSMHEWDLGLYINYTIVKCLGSDRIFEQNNPFGNINHQSINKLNGKSRNNNRKEQKQKQQARQTEQLINAKYQKITKNKKIQKQQKQLILQYLRKQHAFKQIRKTLIEDNLNSKFAFLEDSHKSNRSSFIGERKSLDASQVYQKILYNSQQKNNEILNQVQQAIKSVQEQTQNQRLKKLQQIQRQKQKEVDLELKRQKKAKKLQQKKLKQQQLLKATKFLRDGLFLTKYAQGAINPYKKRVYLSEDEQKLCWHNKGQKQKQSKSILIKQIQSVDIGEIGPGVQKHIGKNKVKNKRQFITIKLTSKDRKVLQFGEPQNQKLVGTFAKNLITFVNSKKYAPDLNIEEQQSIILF